MSILIPVKYHSRQYPAGIQAKVCEVAGHFDTVTIGSYQRYSLHTEYSYASRRLDSHLIGQFPAIKRATKHGVPQLWRDSEWAIAFADFIHALVGCNGKNPPEVIEIHPPFDDYCVTFNKFLACYSIFEKRIGQLFPSTVILLENRFGTRYRGGRFLVTSPTDIADLVLELDTTYLNLGIALDVPQLVSQIGGVNALLNGGLETMLSTLHPARHRIVGLHLWGKKNSQTGRRCSHVGNFDSYFEDEPQMKNLFLKGLLDLLSDGRARYFVPEVNSNDIDVCSIVRDMESVGFMFNGVT